MHTKLLMTSTAVFLVVLGLGQTFFATELADYFHGDATFLASLFLQLSGALYFALALLNWMARENALGGIYNRPIVLSNLAHFWIGGLALVKGLMKHPELPWIFWVVSGLYLLFALSFGVVFFLTPVSKKKAIAART